MQHPHNTQETQLRPMTEADLASVLRWRNHPDIRRFMYTRHEITPEEHSRWFHKVRQDSNRHLLIFQPEDTALGFVQISCNGHNLADWGFYLAPEAPRGTGSALGKSALTYAFSTLKLHKLCGEALGFNEKSIRFHLKLGFTQEGVLRQQHFDGEQYHDIYRFGLLASEWENQS